MKSGRDEAARGSIPGSPRVGGFRVALDMALRALSKYDFCFVGMEFPEVGSLGMEANGVGSKRIFGECRSGEVSPPDSGAVLVEESQQASREVSRASSRMQKVAKPSRRSGAVTEYLARARVGTRSKCPRGSSRAGQARVPTATTPGAIGATRSGISRVARTIGRPGRGGKKLTRLRLRPTRCKQNGSGRA